MAIFDTSAPWDEYQLFKFNVEQKHIDKCILNQTLSPIEFALMDFLKSFDGSAQIVLCVDKSSAKSSSEERKYRTEIESKAFQIFADEMKDGMSNVKLLGSEKRILMYDEQLNTWLNRLNQSLMSNSKLPGLIVVQLKVKRSSPCGELSFVRYRT